MEIRQLRAFVAIAESGTFTAGALRVHVTQAAISMQIRQLENELGAKLFVRAPRRVILTEAGEHLLHRARLILREHDAAKMRLPSWPEQKRAAENRSALGHDYYRTAAKDLKTSKAHALAEVHGVPAPANPWSSRFWRVRWTWRSFIAGEARGIQTERLMRTRCGHRFAPPPSAKQRTVSAYPWPPRN